VTFRDLIAANQRNSLVLVLIFCLFITGVAIVLGLAIVAVLDPDRIAHLQWGEVVLVGSIAAGIALAISLIGYLAGDRMILAVSHARPITHDDDPELFNVVEEMAIAAGASMPRVYLIEDEAPNAFATGRDPRHAAITVTTGLRNKLTREELQGVIAHEMSHVRNLDIRLMLLMAVLVGMVAMLADFLWQAARFSAFTGGRRRDGDGGGAGALGLVLIAGALVLGILAPILAQIIQLAVSREREYLADASAIEFDALATGARQRPTED
jgi:heat shock protein HtpX